MIKRSDLEKGDVLWDHIIEGITLVENVGYKEVTFKVITSNSNSSFRSGKSLTAGNVNARKLDGHKLLKLLYG